MSQKRTEGKKFGRMFFKNKQEYVVAMEYFQKLEIPVVKVIGRIFRKTACEEVSRNYVVFLEKPSEAIEKLKRALLYHDGELETVSVCGEDSNWAHETAVWRGMSEHKHSWREEKRRKK